MTAWPSLLPRPQFAGYQLAPADQTVRTDMEVGSARSRRRTASRSDKITVNWLFTDAQMAIFRAFCDVDADGGAAWFSVDLAHGDAGLRNREARFIGPWQATPTPGLNWEVTATLETRGGELTADQIRGAVMGLVSLSGVYPSLALNFAGDKSLDSRITFTRPSIGTYWDVAGVLRTAASGEARFDHDPVTHESLGLLIEEVRTNLFIYSALMSDASWTAENATITLVSSVVPAPDGTFSAYKLVQNTTAAVNHRVQKTATAVIGTTYTLSGYFKAAGYNTVTLMLTDNSGARCFNLSTGVSSAPPGGEANATTYSMTHVGNGWYRCSVTGVALGTGSGVQIRLSTASCTGFTTAGDGTSGIYAWGFQVEAGAFPTSYIPTTTATVTRSADHAGLHDSNFTNWFNATAGTFMVAAKSSMRAAGSPRILGGTGAMSGLVFSNTDAPTSVGSYNFVASVGQANAASSFATSAKAAVAYSSSGRAVTKGGATPATDSHLLEESGNVATNLYLGRTPYLNGTISRLAFYPTRLPDADLQALTA